MDDYGKVAEFEKRIKILEKKLNDFSVNAYSVTKEGCGKSNSHTFDFKIKAYCSCFVKIDCIVLTECEKYSCVFELNGLTAAKASASGNENKQLFIPLSKGENTFSVTLSSDYPFCVESCSAETFGAVTYSESNVVLSVINEESQSVVMFLYDGEVAVKRYIGGLLTNLFIIKDVCSAAICKMGDNYLLLYSDKEKTLNANLYDCDFNFISAAEIDDETSSVCAVSGNPCTAFAVKGNAVYRYTVDDNLASLKEYAGLTAKNVKCDPSIPGYIIITDHNGTDKLVAVSMSDG